MARYMKRSSSQECLEYHGNTTIERIRRRNGMIRRDWLFFDSVEEAADYFNDHCACQEAV